MHEFNPYLTRVNRTLHAANHIWTMPVSAVALVPLPDHRLYQILCSTVHPIDELHVIILSRKLSHSQQIRILTAILGHNVSRLLFFSLGGSAKEDHSCSFTNRTNQSYQLHMLLNLRMSSVNVHTGSNVTLNAMSHITIT